MKVIILAAGQGKRLIDLTKGLPKCLIRIGDETLLSREIRILNELGFNRENIVVVGGYKSEVLENYPVTLIKNLDYAVYENSYSLWLALSAIDDDALVLDADLVFDKKIICDALKVPDKNIVLTKRSKDLFESTGVIVGSDNVVEAIGKQYHDSGFVYISIFKISKEAIRDLKCLLREDDSLKTWYTLALTRLMRIHTFYNHTTDAKWHEIDYPSDYNETIKLFGIGDK